MAPAILLLGAAALPIAFLAARFATEPDIDVSALSQTLAFALLGAAAATIVGGALGILAGTLEIPGRRWLVAFSAALIAAPPAFWWIGFTRAATLPGVSGLAAGAALAGTMLAPIPLLLVLAAAREIPSNAYEAARLALGPATRVWFVLLPILRPALTGGFLLTAIVLLGESEIPFLFGFRTSMTDVVTRFSQTFDVGAVIPTVVPLLLTVLAAALLLIDPLFAVLLPSSRGGRGVIRKPAGAVASAAMYLLPVLVGVSLSGYARAAASAAPDVWQRLPVDQSAVASVARDRGPCGVLCPGRADGSRMDGAWTGARRIGRPAGRCIHLSSHRAAHRRVSGRVRTHARVPRAGSTAGRPFADATCLDVHPAADGSIAHRVVGADRGSHLRGPRCRLDVAKTG
jgi:ABC-type Fe3+ transport system permease subunit